MKNKKINIHDFDDEPLYVKTPGYFYLYCCDCGLRHIIIVERYRKGIRIGFARDDYATKDMRKLRKIKVVRGNVK